MTTYQPDYIAKLQEELARVTQRGGAWGTFTVDARACHDVGKQILGATETEVISHLTSGRDYVSGRKHRFPGIGNGWNFESAINAAGYRIVYARNYRNQRCRVVTRDPLVYDRDLEKSRITGL